MSWSALMELINFVSRGFVLYRLPSRGVQRSWCYCMRKFCSI